MMRCDLRSLEIFVDVASTNSMACTARRLKITQPAVSQQIARLERRYAVRLFDRTAGGVVLTLEGERLLRLVAPLFEAIAEIDTEFAGSAEASSRSNSGPTVSL